MIEIFRITSMKIIGQVTTRQTYAIRPRSLVPALEIRDGSSHAPHNRRVAWRQPRLRGGHRPVKHLARLLVVFVLATLAVIPAATAANRMWMDFHDDPVFRWN